MHRLFVALVPPDEVKTPLLAAMGGIEGARWQTAEQLHLTLAFVGEVDRHTANRLVDGLAAASSAPLDLSVVEPGLFETARGGRVASLFARVRATGVEALAVRVQQCCRRAGVSPDSRRFVPHITMARFPAGGIMLEAARRFMETPLPPVCWRADRFWLLESRLGQGGPHYEPILDYPLRG